MRFVMFYHSLISDWNHGNAHFLRGVVSELLARRHSVHVLEPANAWSMENLLRDHGAAAVEGFHKAFPGLSSTRYNPAALDLDAALEGADVVLVHEWNEPELVSRIGRHRATGAKSATSAESGRYKLFFHDTHHRMATDPKSMRAYDLSHYDGVLAFGKVIADLYASADLARRCWVWHEAADTRVFRPSKRGSGPGTPHDVQDIVWIGNWGDDERTEELREFLIEPVRALRIKCTVWGVRYPATAVDELRNAGIDYRGWIPNHRVPEAFANAKLTLHIPRRPYVRALPGVPTIRVFEALACGIPLISAPWEDRERLFRGGKDYRVVADGKEMTRAIRDLLQNPEKAAEQARNGLETVLSRHTCRHRVDELLSIVEETGQ